MPTAKEKELFITSMFTSLIRMFIVNNQSEKVALFLFPRSNAMNTSVYYQDETLILFTTWVSEKDFYTIDKSQLIVCQANSQYL